MAQKFFFAVTTLVMLAVTLTLAWAFHLNVDVIVAIPMDTLDVVAQINTLMQLSFLTSALVTFCFFILAVFA